MVGTRQRVLAVLRAGLAAEDDDRHDAAMADADDRDPTLIASGFLVGFLGLGLIGMLMSLIGAHWGYLMAFAVIAAVSASVLLRLRRTPVGTLAHPLRSWRRWNQRRRLGPYAPDDDDH